MFGKRFYWAISILVIFSLVFLNLAFVVEPVAAGEPSKDPVVIARNVYKGLTGLTPDKTASDWLATHKTSGDLERLTAYLLGIVYNPQSSEKLAVNLYTAITGLNPDNQARDWLKSFKSKDDLASLTKYLLGVVLGPPQASNPVNAPGSKWVFDPRDVSIPVLMYHYIAAPGEGARDEWSTSYEEFEKQITWLWQNGYSSITVDELYDFMTTGKIRNPRSFVAIFDDNWYESVTKRVIPLMKEKYEFVPTLALYTNAIYESGRGVFTWEELQALQRANVVDVQSHSISHPLIPALNQLSDQDLWNEVYNSRMLLEQKLGKPVTGFITPGGSVSDRVLDVARNAGYKTFFLLWENGGVKYGDDPFWIYRVNMVNTLNFNTFVSKMQRYSTSPDKITQAQPRSILPDPMKMQNPHSILADNQIVAYYGHPYTPLMGILGEYSVEDLVPIIKAKAREYDDLNGEKGVIAAFHIVFGTVQPGGAIGIIDDATLMKYIDIAKQNNMIVILDHQIGKGSVTDAVAQMLPYLKYDNVHLAIDPEWHTAFPMQEVGGISGYDVNAAQELMQSYMEANNIPGKKILIVHQFAPMMIMEREVISANYPRIDLVHDMDGFGGPATKNSHYEYNKLATNIPLKGFKLFYSGRRTWGYDTPLMTPAEVLSLDPQPAIIIYQ